MFKIKIRTDKTYDRGDKYLTNFICGYLLIQSINNLMASTGHNTTAWFFLSRGILAVLLLFAIIPIINRRLYESILIEAFFLIALLFSYLWGDIGSNFTSIAFNLLFVYLPMGFACAAINNYSTLINKLYYVAWPVEAICIATGVLGAAYGSFIAYSQAIGYFVLIPLLVHLDHFQEKRKWYDVVMAIIDFVFIVSYASRGPIICVAVFIVLSIVFSPSLDLRRKSVMVLGISLVAVILFVNLSTIASGLANILSKLGRTSRTLRLLASGTLGYSANRNILFDHYQKKIFEAPFIGYGLACSWDMSSYPHNIFLEVLLAFGIPFGLLISILIATFAFKGVTQNDPTSRRLSIIFFSELISLLWSGSFIMNSTFFVGFALFMRGGVRTKSGK